MAPKRLIIVVLSVVLALGCGGADGPGGLPNDDEQPPFGDPPGDDAPRSACEDADWDCAEPCADADCLIGCFGNACVECLTAFLQCGYDATCDDDLGCMAGACPGECTACFGSDACRPAPGQEEPDPDPPPTDPPPAAAPLPEWLVGNWSSGGISALASDYFDPNTGAWSAPQGVGSAYSFERDGAYLRVSYSQAQLYTCAMTIFASGRGTAAVDADVLTLYQQTGTYRTENCGTLDAGGTDEPSTTRYRMSFSQDGGNIWMRLTSDDGVVVDLARGQ